MDGRVEKEQFAVVHRNYLDVFFFTHICSTIFYSVLISDAGVPNVGTPWKNLSISLHDFFVQHNNFTAQCRWFGAFCETWKSSRYYLQLLAT